MIYTPKLGDGEQRYRAFTLSPAFLKKFEGKQPKWGPIGYFVFKRTYARRLPNGGYEEFWQTLKRVAEGTFNLQKMHVKDQHRPWDNAKAQASAQEMFQRMWDFKFLPPGRGLRCMGTDMVYEKGSACLNNCGFVSTEDIGVNFADPFCFLMDMSMLGVGVGGDTKGAGKVRIQVPNYVEETYIVEDSREGWVNLIRRILNAYAGVGTMPKVIDYSLIRAKGEPVKGVGGTASGPGPLIELVDDLDKLLYPGGEDAESYLITSTIIVDIFNFIGKCVVSGGIRRTAEIMFGEPDDKEFGLLKDSSTIIPLYDALSNALTPEAVRLAKEAIDAHPLNSRRWASNNSNFCTVGMDYTEMGERNADNGEPGGIWLDNIRAYSRMVDAPDHKDYKAAGCNPCGEQSLESFELCCLVETFPNNCTDINDFKRTLKYAYLYAKTVTLVPTHDIRTNQVMMWNRRIGTSQSGIQQAKARLGRREHIRWCDQGYKYVMKLDKDYSKWLCIPESIKKTSVKPSGTVSLLVGATPGIHYEEWEYIIRNVRISDDSPFLQACIDAGYPVEKAVKEPNTHVVSFPVKVEGVVRSKPEVSIWEQFTDAVAMQKWWSDNQVSVTISFSTNNAVLTNHNGELKWVDVEELTGDEVLMKDAKGKSFFIKDESEDIARCLETFEDQLKSISFLPYSTHGYVQAPLIAITKEKYEELSANITELDLSSARHEVDDEFCSGGKCLI